MIILSWEVFVAEKQNGLVECTVAISLRGLQEILDRVMVHTITITTLIILLLLGFSDGDSFLTFF